jgi:hypothetical protein
MQNKVAKLIVLLLILQICAQCSLFKKQSESIHIQRFEQDFYAIDTNKFELGLNTMLQKYPNFYPVFVEGVLGIASDYRNLEEYIPQLYLFRAHPQLIGLNDTISAHFPTLDNIEPAVGEIINKYNNLFPLERVDEVVTFLSEFGHKAIVYDGGIGIGLDMFLGKSYPFYDGLGIPNYVIDYLTPDQIIVNVARVLAEDFVPPAEGAVTMLDKIIEEGKKLYFAEQLMPKTPDYQIIEYSDEQYIWCGDNVFNIWSYIIENDLLYETNYAEYQRYVEDAPTTLGMPPESPGKVGIWLGWQIVKKYMEENKNESLEDLMANVDAQQILKDSKYKPKAK